MNPHISQACEAIRSMTDSRWWDMHGVQVEKVILEAAEECVRVSHEEIQQIHDSADRADLAIIACGLKKRNEQLETSLRNATTELRAAKSQRDRELRINEVLNLQNVEWKRLVNDTELVLGFDSFATVPEARSLVERADELVSAIKDTVTQCLDHICWLDVYQKLAKLVGVEFDPLLIPPEDLRANCARFIASIYNGYGYTPDRLTLHVENLEKRLKSAE